MRPDNYTPHTGYDTFERAGYNDWTNGRQSLAATFLAAGQIVEYRHYEAGWRQSQLDSPHIARRENLGN